MWLFCMPNSEFYPNKAISGTPNTVTHHPYSLNAWIALADQWDARVCNHIPRLGVIFLHVVEPLFPGAIVVVGYGLLSGTGSSLLLILLGPCGSYLIPTFKYTLVKLGT